MHHAPTSLLLPVLLVVNVLSSVMGCSSPQSGDAAMAAQYDLAAAEPLQMTSEVPVGKFMISVPVELPDHAAWYRVTFDLALGVAPEDADPATDFVAGQERQLRDEVASAFRLAEIDHLESAKLSELRVVLVDAANRLIGRPLVKAVHLANFSAEVQ